MVPISQRSVGVRFVRKPRRGSTLTPETNFCSYRLSVGGNGCAGGRSIATAKYLVKICINPWVGVRRDSDIWSVIWVGYIFLLQ